MTPREESATSLSVAAVLTFFQFAIVALKGEAVKINGAQIMLWSGIGIIVGLIPGFLGVDALKVIGPLGSLLSSVGSLSGIAFIVGFIIFAFGKKTDADREKLRGTKFWLGLMLAVGGLALPGFFAYEMFFVPGGGDAIFLLMIFGPFGLAAVALGVILMVRNRK